MSEYKENTVGWWLSQLKEPLKSRALDVANGFLHERCPSLKEAIRYLQEGGAYRITEEAYWRGVLGGVSQYAISPDFCSEMYLEGYYAAIGWSPKPKDGGEDKAIVDSPAPDVWGEKIPIGKIEIFTKGWDANTPIEPLPEGGYIDGKDFLPFRMKAKIPRAREIEAPERAVVGYEEPKPIDTIEKKHELRIKNLEARVKQLEDQLFKLLESKNG